VAPEGRATGGPRLDPKNIDAHYGLGAILCDVKHDFEGAIAQLRKAIEIDPKHAGGHNNLGNALRAKGKVDEAVAEFRKAIELDPKVAQPHNNLGLALRSQSKLEEAIAEFRKAIEPDPKLAQAHNNLRQCEEMLAFQMRLSAVFRGEARPANTDEQLRMAELGHRMKHYGAVARLYADAFDAQPKLAENLEADHRYKAAVCASLAAAGRG
jgi:tetratricopeptide (TPR) repeat protein